MEPDIDALRAKARAANQRPISEREDGTMDEYHDYKLPSVFPDYVDEEEQLEELYLGEEARVFDERLVDGFQMLGVE